MQFQHLILMLLLLILAGCAPETPEQEIENFQAPQEEPYIKTDEQQPAENGTANKTQEMTLKNESIIRESGTASVPPADKAVQEPEQLPPKPTAADGYPDAFDGQILNTAKYSTLM